MTGGAVRKKMEGKFCPFAFSLAVIHWGLELWVFLERARGREWNVFSHCSSLGDPTAWASLVLVSWSHSWDYTSGVRNILGSSSAPDHPVRCPEGWLPELFFRRWCFLLVCREQHVGLQATFTGQEKASTWEDYIFPSSFQPELRTSASQFSCVESLHL